MPTLHAEIVLRTDRNPTLWRGARTACTQPPRSTMTYLHQRFTVIAKFSVTVMTDHVHAAVCLQFHSSCQGRTFTQIVWFVHGLFKDLINFVSSPTYPGFTPHRSRRSAISNVFPVVWRLERCSGSSTNHMLMTRKIAECGL